MKTKNITIIGIMSAIMIISQISLSFLANIELVSLLTIVFTLIFGFQTIYIIYVFVFAQGLIYGFSLYWINYLYIWTILFIIAMLFKNKRKPLFWAIISGSFGLGFGALCSFPYVIIGGISYGMAYWIRGMPYDIVHCLGNFFIALLLFNPLYDLLDNLNSQM